MPTDSDQDILDSLQEIDEDQILGEEVTFDSDLDFGLEEDPPAVANSAPEATQEDSAPPAESPPPAIQPPPAPATQPAKPAPEKKRKAKKGTSKATEVQAEKVVVETADAEVGEMVLRAKTIRIIADKVVIEPKDISISP